ncbi:hypothetical protein P4O66_014030, partial [Electrophorus voltai]
PSVMDLSQVLSAVCRSSLVVQCAVWRPLQGGGSEHVVSPDTTPSSQMFRSYCPGENGRYTALQVEFTAAVKTSAEQKDLILKLEQDLSTIQTMSSLPRPDTEGADLSGMDGIPEPIKEATALFSGMGGSSQAELPQGQMDSLLSIISSQRERFRARNQELEAESRSLQQTLQALQSELDSLRADNIKLYEKIKFLQIYPTRAAGTDDTVMRYSSQYEERLDPFASFSRKGRVILSNKMARTVAFFYTLFLHCLVFLVLYKTAWSESIGRDCAAFCAKNVHFCSTALWGAFQRCMVTYCSPADTSTADTGTRIICTVSMRTGTTQICGSDVSHRTNDAVFRAASNSQLSSYQVLTLFSVGASTKLEMLFKFKATLSYVVSQYILLL